MVEGLRNAPLYGDPGAFRDIDTEWPSTEMSDWPVQSSVLDSPGMYWSAMKEGVLDLRHPNFVHDEMNKTREWASQVTLRHLLSHTSGLLRSGHGSQVEEYYDRDIKDYRSAHLAVLKGVIKEREDAGSVKCSHPDVYDADGGSRIRLAPFGYEPGTSRCYPNHGFGLLGYIIGELTDGRPYYGYYDKIRVDVLDPLGVDDVVPNNWRLDDGLDAWPHGHQLEPDDPARFMSTGGWSATAQDLARIMCATDRSSNRLRLLNPGTVTEMQTMHFSGADGNQPLGQIISAGGGHDHTVPAGEMLEGSYEVTLSGHDGVEGASDSITVHAQPKPASYPTATIVLPEQGGEHTVSGGLETTAELSFEGSAVDGDGSTIGGTHYRWTASRAGEDDILLCAGTSAPDGPFPGGDGDPGALAAEKSCAEFTTGLAGHHYAGHTNYTITLEVWNDDGESDSDTTSVKVFVPPEG